MSPPLISKEAARYTSGGGREYCSLCRHFSPRRGGRCARVLGGISPQGWCKLFSREIRALIPDASSFNGGGGGPSLSLDFMRPGTLDPRITFTRASTATYFDSAGVLRSAAINAPRWDYDPATLALRGLLLEDQRTNLFLNSTVVIGMSGSNVTPNIAVAPDGTTTGDLLYEGTGSSFHVAVPTLTLAASTVHTISVFAKQNNPANRYFQVGFDDGGGVGGLTTFDLQTGTISGQQVKGAVTIASNSMQAAGNGWYRCSTSTSILTATSARLYFGLSMAANSGFFPAYQGLGSNNGVLMWGMQVEAGDFATSYIPTTGATVTRSIDSCLIPPANMGFFTGSPGGSWFAEFDYFDTTPPSSRIIGRPDAGGGSGVVYVNGSRFIGQYDVTSGLLTANATSVNVAIKAVTTWTSGQAKACTNGGAVATSALLTTGYASYATTGIRFLSVGPALAADNTPGHMRAVRYWPTILSDAQMQAMTA